MASAREGNATAGRAGRREWAGLGVLALPGLLITLDFSVLTQTVPKLNASRAALSRAVAVS
jgi:hypothetical protein